MGSPSAASPDGLEQGPTSSKRPAPRGTAFYPRKRAVTACQVCRARRTKCDNLKPKCSFCLKTGATCIQSPTDLSSFDPASLKILERLDDVEQLLKSIPGQGNSDGGPRSSQVTHDDHSRISNRTALNLSAVLPDKVEDIQEWPIFTSDGAKTISDKTSSRVSDQSAVQSSVAVPSARSPEPISSLLEEMPQRVNELMENFFHFVHVKNPILDEAETRRIVTTTIVEGIDWSLSSCLALIIVSLGSLASQFGITRSVMAGSTTFIQAQTLFQAAERRLGPCIGSDDLMATQCLFLSGVYMMYTFQPRKAWRFFNLALTTCQEFPFLAPTALLETSRGGYSAQLGGSERRQYILQQALYWSSWKSERELRSELEPPDFALADDDRGLYPVFFPTPPQQQQTFVPEPSTCSNAKYETTAWYFYLAEISLRRLSSRICAELLALRRAHPRSGFLAAAALTVPTWEMQAQEWKASLPPSLSLDAPAEQDDICQFILRGHFINLYELIYWTFVCAALKLQSATSEDVQNGSLEDPEPPFVLQLAVKGLETHVQRIVVNEPGFTHRHHGTWPMIRTCTRSALVLVASELCLSGLDKPSKLLQMPQGWYESVESVLDLLSYWESEAPDLHTIRHLLCESLGRVAC